MVWIMENGACDRMHCMLRGELWKINSYTVHIASGWDGFKKIGYLVAKCVAIAWMLLVVGGGWMFLVFS